MLRSEMDAKFQWDLTAIYADDSAWEKAMAEAAEAVDGLSALPGTLGESAEALKTGLDRIAAALEKTERPAVYAFLRKAGDGGDATAQEMEARGNALSVKLGAALAFMNPEILAIVPEELSVWMEKEEMTVYRHLLDDIVRSRSHTLDSEREKMLALLGEIAETPSLTYEMLTDVNMELPMIRNDEGEAIQLTSGNFGVYRESVKREVREEAFRAMFGTYRKYGDTFAALYGGAVKLDNYFAKVRGYESACQAALDEGNVPVAVYDSLIEAVHRNLPTMEKYLRLRKKALGLEKMDVLDLYVPMVENVNYLMPLESAKALVKNALLPLGQEYQQLLNRAFNERWMDIYENKGKTSGAFSCGVYGVHPYVLLNYSNTLNDAFTVAHELGHAMHSYYSDRTQPFINHDYRIMVAEVASTVNEVLLTMYLLKTETDPRRRAYVLNHFLEGFRTTLLRQTLFAEFERKAHEECDAGVPMTDKRLSEIYHDLVAQYYSGAEMNELADHEWSYIPHFYRAFYVYQYATGFSAAVAIARHILETGDASGYLQFLTTGGSDYPLEELKLAGIDLTDPATVQSALDVFKQTVDEFEEILLSQ